MPELFGSIRLRPTRIGLLVRPTPHSRNAISRFMQLCTCLWGGRFNPIIPVARTMPAPWRRDTTGEVAGRGLADAYLRFFEPDVFVEAEEGLAREVGLPSDQASLHRRRVVSLADFVDLDAPRRADFAHGLNIFDLYRHRYERELQFVPRHNRRYVVFNHADRVHPFFEAAFGVFPQDEALAYIRTGYSDAFEPKALDATPASCLEVMRGKYSTPFTVGRYGIERQDARDNPTVYVFHSSKIADLIDFWNLTQFRRDVFPVEIAWADQFAGIIREMIKRNYRPLPGNPNGIMIHTTVAFGRSVKPAWANELVQEHLRGLPDGSLSVKDWYDPIWRTHWRHGGVQPRRAVLSAAEEALDISLQIDSDVATFRAIAPQFAERFGGGRNHARWANVLSLRDYTGTSDFALSYLPNTKKPTFPRLNLGPPTLISREGIVLLQEYTQHREFVRLLRQQDAIVGWLKSNGVEAVPSNAGRSAEQVIRGVGGLPSCSIFADEGTLHLLDKMAKTMREAKDGSIAQYPDRTAGVAEWKEAINRRKGGLFQPVGTLSSFTKKQIIRLGIAVRCTHCSQENWYDLSQLDYLVRCERCLRDFDFPQGELTYSQKDWRFRVVGPFSLPGYALGAYSTALTLRVLSRGLHGGDQPMTYSTGLNLVRRRAKFEIDFVAWYREGQTFWIDPEPSLVFGESKSFGQEIFHQRDVARLKILARNFPGSYFVLSTLKKNLASSEKSRLREFAKWGRQPLKSGQPRASVIILTATELFSDWLIESAWKEMGGEHAKLVEHPSVRLDDLSTLADLTQRLYLDMPGQQEIALRRLRRRQGS